MPKPRIVMGGALAHKPGKGGHTWVFLQYLLGLRALGWDVLFVDRLDRSMAGAGSDSPSGHPGIAYVRSVFERWGLDGQYAIAIEDEPWVGRSRSEVLEFTRSSVGLINVMGFIDDPDVLAAAPFNAFLDIDPGFPQIWRELGLHDAFAGHDRFVTIGGRLGHPGCGAPDCGLPWIYTPQPVVLEHWPVQPSAGRAFTSIASWRGGMAPLEYRGRRLGLRVHEFRRFLDLPRRTAGRFEMALDIHPDEEADLRALSDHGWSLVDPAEAAGDPLAYRAFIQRSEAEFMVAKNLYVDTAVGWFSDRSICYLASGRPVVAQDTGFTEELPVGRGLLAFSDLDEAVAAVEEVRADPVGHARAARAVAEAHFDSRVVLPRLVDALTARVPVGAVP